MEHLKNIRAKGLTIAGTGHVSRRRLTLYAAYHRLCAEYIEPLTKHSGSTLVFLHEGFGSIPQWGDFPCELSIATGCPALVYERWGYGNSDPLTEPLTLRYMHEEALYSLPQVLTQCSISDVILIGHSDGGSIALIFAAQYSEMVRGVITEAAHVFIEEITMEGILQAVRAYESTHFKELLARYHGDNTEMMFRSWTDLWLSPESWGWNIEEYLPKITCPLLAFQGEDDEYGTLAQVEAIAEQVSGPVKTVLIPKCAHIPHQQARETVLSEMTGFITTIMC